MSTPSASEQDLLQKTEELARQRLAELEDLYRNAPVGLCLLDRDLRFLRINDRLAEINGIPASAHIGKTIRELMPRLADAVEPSMRSILATGKPRLNIEIVSETPARPGIQRSWLEQWLPTRDADERVSGLSIVVEETTERKQVVEALLQNERRFRQVAESLPQLIWTCTADGPCDYLSPQWVRYTGKSEAEQLGYAWLEQLHPDDRRRVMSQWEATASRGENFEIEFRIRRHDGVYRWFRTLAVPLRNEAGTIVKWFGSNTDIDDIKQTEDALRKSEERFRSSFANASIGFAMTDPDGRFVEANPAYCAITGYSMWELLALEFSELLHPDDRAENIALARKMLEGSIPDFVVENRYIRKGGEFVWVRQSVSLVRNEDNTPRWIIALVENANARRQAEEALKRSREDLDRAQSVGQIGWWRLDIRKNTLEWSSENHRIFGVPVGTPLTYESFLAKVHPDDRDYVNARWAAGIQGEPYDIEHRILTDGRVKWVREKAYLEVDDRGELLGGFGITQDITQRKQFEEALARSKDELEQRVAERTAELALRATQLRALAGELTLSEQRERSRLAKVLHDHLQQLLVAAKFRIAVVSRGGDDILKQATREIEMLIDECIAASRSLTAELSPPILHEADLNAGLEWLARRMAEYHGLVVDLNLEALPPLPNDLKVLLFESIRELLFNVVKHAQTRSSVVSLRRVDGMLQLTVSDQGVGFDRNVILHAGDSGIGFGLFSVRERLELFGGSFEIQSTPGAGSRISLSVPLAEAAIPQPVRAKAALLPEMLICEPSQASDAGRKIRILLADDHTVVRRGMANMLNNEPDFDIVGEAEDGQEAVKVARKLLPDIILMDMSMPRLNGVEATRILSNELPEIRIIGLSMFEETERAQAMRDAGAVHYMTKSDAVEELIAAIRKHGVRENQPSDKT